MIRIGAFNTLKVLRIVDFGVYLDDGNEGILLPSRFVTGTPKPGDEIEVFLYHDSEDRPIATTQKPKAILGEIAKLECVSVTNQGAFLDWGLMKDIFVPLSQQISTMIPKGSYLVKIVMDERTGRLIGTEKIQRYLNNENLTVKEKDEVLLTVYRRTDIGYLMIINNIHTGVLHFNEIYRKIGVGDSFTGFIKKIYPETNNIDIAAGVSGYKRVENESEKVMRLLKENGGTLPFSDKSEPDAIYDYFGMSKKTFKMTIGNLYKNRLILIDKNNITLIVSSNQKSSNINLNQPENP
jgi:predicted RNA-binding protein (virulence factor B family)